MEAFFAGLGVIIDPVFYLAAIPAILLTGISKGGFAGGLGALGVPIMALATSPLEAAAVMLPILIVMDWVGLYAYRHTWHRAAVLTLLPGAVIGVGLAWALADQVSDNHVRIMVGLIAVIFALNYWINRADSPARTSPGKRMGTFWGAIAGFTSFVAHAGGPPYQVYALGLKLDKTLYVGTSVWFFAALNLIKLGPFWAAEILDLSRLATAGVLLPLAPLGMWLGIKLHKLVPERPFYRIAYILLFAAGLRLLWSGVEGLF
ncbi:MAG: sulfite exporter TauE/SafE family protein [Alphaproteobacteria bacterium]